VWNAGAAADIEHSIADWHANNAAARISYVDEATATLKQPARPPCDTNERQEYQFAVTHTEAAAGVKGVKCQSKMDCEGAVESDGPRHAVPDEIMNPSTPLHRLERDIAERVHAKMQREIAKHDEARCEAEPSKRHLVAENAAI
jgi:hypothetical protein